MQQGGVLPPTSGSSQDEQLPNVSLFYNHEFRIANNPVVIKNPVNPTYQMILVAVTNFIAGNLGMNFYSHTSLS